MRRMRATIESPTPLRPCVDRVSKRNLDSLVSRIHDVAEYQSALSHDGETYRYLRTPIHTLGYYKLPSALPRFSSHMRSVRRYCRAGLSHP